MHLYDRVKVNKGLGQKYGTQLNKPILNLEETNNARVGDGWISIEDWIEEFNSNHKYNSGDFFKSNSPSSMA